MNVEYRDLVQVFAGSQTEITVVRSLLNSHGIECFLPNKNIKIADPFITGGNALTMAIVCPVDQATEALRIIEETRAGVLAEEPAREEERDDLERLGAFWGTGRRAVFRHRRDSRGRCGVECGRDSARPSEGDLDAQPESA